MITNTSSLSIGDPTYSLAAWEEALAKGEGAVQLESRMVDRPIAERARRVIEQAEAIVSS